MANKLGKVAAALLLASTLNSEAATVKNVQQVATTTNQSTPAEQAIDWENQAFDLLGAASHIRDKDYELAAELLSQGKSEEEVLVALAEYQEVEYKSMRNDILKEQADLAELEAALDTMGKHGYNITLPEAFDFNNLKEAGATMEELDAFLINSGDKADIEFAVKKSLLEALNRDTDPSMVIQNDETNQELTEQLLEIKTNEVEIFKIAHYLKNKGDERSVKEIETYVEDIQSKDARNGDSVNFIVLQEAAREYFNLEEKAVEKVNLEKAPEADEVSPSR